PSIVVLLMGDTLSDSICVLERIGISLLVFLITAIGCICVLCVCGCRCQSDNCPIINSITPQRSQIELLELRRQYIDNSTQRHPTIYSPIRISSSVNSTGFVSQPSLQNEYNDISRTTLTTSQSQPIPNLPPIYDDIIQQNSITITLQRQTELPPSYNDFMRGRNERSLV
ncbi:unnamed protein product, partial [Adineta steineri]